MNKKRNFKIGNRIISEKQPVFVVAEISANHGQNLKTALKMIKKAKECGADAVKFQTYTPDNMTINVNNKFFQIKHPKWGGQTLYQLYKKAYTPFKWFKELKKACDDIGIIFFSTAYDSDSADFLEELGVKVHKTASFELVDLPFIEYLAGFKKPLIISTGMGTDSEIKRAIDAAKRGRAKDILLLKCTSNYPAAPSDMNLKSIPYMKNKFKCLVGLSDHSLSLPVPLTAVALGAVMVERHFCLTRKNETPDSFFSTEPDELKELVDSIRIVEQSLGNEKNVLTSKELKSKIFRRSLFAIKDIKKGEALTKDNIRSIRPADGLEPLHLNKILKSKAKRNIKRGTPLNWNLIK